MPRYYFDIHDAKGFHPDEFGEALADLEEARDQAQVLLPDIMREELPNRDRHTVICEVRDETGRIVYRGDITFQGTRF